MPIRILRKIDCGRPAPRARLGTSWRGIAMSRRLNPAAKQGLFLPSGSARRIAAALVLPLWIAVAPPSHAGDWASTLRSISETIQAGSKSGEALRPTSLAAAASDLPLPPYPPPISGLDTPAQRDSGTGLPPATSPKAAMPSSRTLVPPPLPLPAAAEKLVPPALPAPPRAAPVDKPISPPLPAPVQAGEGMPDILRAAFTKAAASPLFGRLLKPERDAISTYYEAHGFKLLWHRDDGALTPAGLAVLDRLAHAAEEGLDPDDYAAAASQGALTHPEEIADGEWRVSAAALAYARDARGARVNPSRLSALITPELSLPSADELLDKLARAEGAGRALDAYNPQGDSYLNLRMALAKLRSETVTPSPDKSGDRGGTEIASVTPDALKGRTGSPAGKRGVAALPPKRVEADIVANMERWRWLPPELGDRYILVNVPEFTLRYINNGALAHVARVVVGKPTSPTPIFSGEMKFLVVNPSWYIPPSILKKEFLPKLAYDPLYAERQGYVVTWHGGQASIRQPPGERNALGRIKFMFPNRHSVYLHDTPARSLFAKSERAFSHGCVRVDQPFKLAEYVLNDKAAWPEKRIEKLIGGDERTIGLSRQLPVHLAYFTLAADADGTLHRFGDIYGLDPRLEAALLPHK